ncbi:hypothetical protein D3C87_518070 [compost metagenome]
MKNFYEYLSSVKREYRYKIKLAVAVDDAVLDKIEKVLKRYDVLEISKPKKSILQRNEIDFPDAGPVETWTINIVTERPLVAQSLTNDLKKGLNVAEVFIRVRGENEPVAVEGRFVDEIHGVLDEAGDSEPATLLGNDEVVEPQIVAYGDDYNQSLLNYLAQVQANRAEEQTQAMGHKSMFGWLDSKTATEDAAFNAEHAGIRPVSGSTLKAKEAKAPLNTAPTGNFDMRDKHASKTYKSGNGLKKIEGKGE